MKVVIFAKSSILGFLLGSEFASVFCFVYHFSTIFPKPWFINCMLVSYAVGFKPTTKNTESGFTINAYVTCKNRQSKPFVGKVPYMLLMY